MSSEKVEALTVYNGGGDPAYSCDVNFTPDKSSYSPSETMVITGDLSLNSDSGATSATSQTCSLSKGALDGPWSGSGVIVVTLSDALPYSGLSVYKTDSMSFTVPASTGSHYYAMGSFLHVAGGVSGMDVNNSMTLPFSVVVAIPPAVNLNFSMLLSPTKRALTSVFVALVEQVVDVVEAESR